MESFLSGRATLAKLKTAEAQPANGTGGCSALFEKKAEPTVSAPAYPALTVQPPDPTAVTAVFDGVPHSHKVSVEVVRVDGAVQGIVVTCKCGERIELDCVY